MWMIFRKHDLAEMQLRTPSLMAVQAYWKRRGKTWLQSASDTYFDKPKG
jgi:hypothetical protein